MNYSYKKRVNIIKTYITLLFLKFKNKFLSNEVKGFLKVRKRFKITFTHLSLSILKSISCNKTINTNAFIFFALITSLQLMT